MAKNDIDWFEITSYGEIKVRTNSTGQQTEHTFYSVPRAIITKFITASKAPTLTDLEGWIKDAKEREKDKSAVPSYGFWNG